jgi:hypothetical protein
VAQEIVWLLVKHFFRQPGDGPNVARLFAVRHAISLQEVRQLVRDRCVADVLLQCYLLFPAARRSRQVRPPADKAARY